MNRPAIARRAVPLTPETLDDIDPRCRGCVYWELDAVSRLRATSSGKAAEQKRLWVEQRQATDGLVGLVLYRGRQPVGHCVVARASAVPRLATLPSGPVGDDALVLVSGRVRDRSNGLGKVLVQALAKHLVQQGSARALEAFGDSRAEPAACFWPTGFLTAVGFTVIQPHPVHPRLRLDLGATVAWKAELEVALERMLGAVRPDPAPRPAFTRTS